MPNILSRSRTGLRSTKWVVLLGLVFAQIAIAGHDIAHESHEHDETCTVFVQSDRDDVLVDETVIDALLSFDKTYNVDSVSTSTASTSASFHARAPPNSE